MLDYDEVRVEGGALYENAERSADYQWIRPGFTLIHLEGDGLNLEGWTIQGEKAEGVCLAWLELGEIDSNFHMVSRPKDR